MEEWLVEVEREGKIPNYEIVIKKIEPQKVLSIREILPDYSHISGLFRKMESYLAKTRGQIVGVPLAI